MDKLESLFRMHHKALCDLAYNLVNDRDAAKDVVQDVFFKLWKNKDGIDFGEKMKHYLFRATSHTALNYLRFHRKIIRIDDPTDFQPGVSPAGDDLMSYQELELRVRSAIDKLPPKCKAIYLLSRHEGLKYQEIADTLGVSLKTVEHQMGIALQKLRKELKPFMTSGFIILFALFGLLCMLLFS
ncbi:MAG TPA: RNA polymerase sigma-70 factor [Cyclobacteriaceae bacterium]|nr:RNA polymerase sigma-70 factor [Cyclobacteriaceae bacterium]